MANSSADYHCKSGALLVGDPWVQDVISKGRKKLQQLPCARKEVEMIGRILDTAPLTGKDATKAGVLKRLSSVALVHIAAHGRMETGEIGLGTKSYNFIPDTHRERLSLDNDRCAECSHQSKTGCSKLLSQWSRGGQS